LTPVSGHARLVVVLLACAVTTLTAAAPAPAYLRNFNVSSASTPSNSVSAKSRYVRCPVGKFAIGTGGLVSPFSDNLGLDRLFVYFGQRVAEGGAVETDPLVNRWLAGAHAFCATASLAPPPQGGAASYVKQVTIRRVKTLANSASAKVLTVACPSSGPARSPSSIGGGGAIDSASPDIVFESMERVAGGTAWRVRAHETDPTNAAWELEVHAVCANITTEIATANYVAPPAPNNAVGVYGPYSSTAPSSAPVQSLMVNCPVPPSNPVNTFIIGGGARVVGSGLRVTPPADVVLTQSHPAGTGPISNGWFAQARETDFTNLAWQLQVRAVCANFSGGPPA
jgi:hypothetical protein